MQESISDMQLYQFQSETSDKDVINLMIVKFTAETDLPATITLTVDGEEPVTREVFSFTLYQKQKYKKSKQK